MPTIIRSFSLCEAIRVPPGFAPEDHGDDKHFIIERTHDGLRIQRRTGEPCGLWGRTYAGNIRGTIEEDVPEVRLEDLPEPEPKRAGARGR